MARSRSLGTSRTRCPVRVAFVYKDGPFPGENTDVGGIDMFRIGEANDEDRALAAGRQLARFEAGMRADPLLGAAEQDALGHSGGYRTSRAPRSLGQTTTR